MYDPAEAQKTWRGKACLNCRRRKMRCDGEKPTCGPCNRRNDGCQYTDRLGITRTQALEDHISYLENRIQDLENSTKSSSSAFIAEPYASQIQPQHSGLEQDLQTSTQRRLDIELPPLPDRWWDLEEPPVQLRQILLDNFLPYKFITGFFLSQPRFIHAFYSTGPLGDNSRPSPALLSTIYLWGVKLSSLDALISYESVFLERATRYVACASSGDHPQKAKHALQAEILLSHYLFWSGHFLEGRYHCNAAASIAISLGYHRIRSTQGTSPNGAVDTIEEGEMINAFWTVFFNDKSWAVAMNVPSALPDHMAHNSRIDTPWPMDMAQYERGSLTSDIRSYDTIQTFLNNPGSSDVTSLFSMVYKAAALLDQASRLASTWKPNMPEVEVTQFHSAFVVLDKGIDIFYETLPSVSVFGDYNAHNTRIVITAHIVARLATIHLNLLFAHQDANANTKCVEASNATIHLMDDVDLVRLGFLPLVVGNCLLKCGQVLIREIVRIRSVQALSADVFTLLSREEELTKSLDRLELIMVAVGVQTPMFRLQRNILSTAREEQL